MQGRIVAVEERYFGSELTVALVGGEGTITVADPIDFEEDGGQLVIDSETLTYTAVNDTTGVITLSGTVADPHDEEARVLLSPATLERVAHVAAYDNPDASEPMEARIPHALYDKILTGIRDPDAQEGETVNVEFEGDELVITDLLGQSPSQDGSFIDPTTIDLSEAVLTDGLAPTVSPRPTVRGGVGFLAVEWPAISNADAVTYAVHVSTEDDFTPDDLTYQGETSGTLFFIRGRAANLLYNPTVETDNSGWESKSSATVTNSTDQAVGGTKSIKVVCPGSVGTEGVQQVYENHADVVEDLFYTLSAYVYWSGSPRDFRLQWNEYTEADAFVIARSAVVAHGGTGWERLSLTERTALTSAKAQVSVENETAAAITFYVDNIQMEPRANMGEFTTNIDPLLEYDVTYYAKIIASDEDGAAAAGDQGQGRMTKANTLDIAAEAVTANEILAGSITADRLHSVLVLSSLIKTAESGQRVEISEDGIQLYNQDNSVVVNLPTEDGASAEFAGRIAAETLGVSGVSDFHDNMTLDSGSIFQFTARQANPSIGPNTQTSYSGTQVDVGDAFTSSQGAYFDTNGGAGGATDTLLLGESNGVDVCRVVELDATDPENMTEIRSCDIQAILDASGAPGAGQLMGVTRIGSYVFALSYQAAGGIIKLHKITQATFAWHSYQLLNATFPGGGSAMTLGGDGTHVIAIRWAVNDASEPPKLFRYDPSTLAFVSSHATSGLNFSVTGGARFGGYHWDGTYHYLLMRGGSDSTKRGIFAWNSSYASVTTRTTKIGTLDEKRGITRGPDGGWWVYDPPARTIWQLSPWDWTTESELYWCAYTLYMEEDHGACTISNGSPATITNADHMLVVDTEVYFTTTGTLPTGLSPSTPYYVIAAGLTTDDFRVSATRGGAAINTSSAGSGVHTLIAVHETAPSPVVEHNHDDQRGKNLSAFVGRSASVTGSRWYVKRNATEPAASALFRHDPTYADVTEGADYSSIQMFNYSETGGFPPSQTTFPADTSALRADGNPDDGVVGWLWGGDGQMRWSAWSDEAIEVRHEGGEWDIGDTVYNMDRRRPEWYNDTESRPRMMQTPRLVGSALNHGWQMVTDCWEATSAVTTGSSLADGFTAAIAGTDAGFSQADWTGHAGVATLGTGTVSSGRCHITAGAGSSFLDDGDMAFGALVRLENLSTSAQRFVVCAGLMDTPIGVNDVAGGTLAVVGFRYQDNLSSGEWQCITGDGSGASGAQASGVPVVADTWYLLEFYWDNSSQTGYWYIDGTLVHSDFEGSGSGFDDFPVPGSATTNLRPAVGIEKLVGATERTVYVDYVWARGDFDTSRRP